MTETDKSKRILEGISPANLRRVAGLNGYSITELARRIKKTRQAVHYAAKAPHRFPRVAVLLEKNLPKRS